MSDLVNKITNKIKDENIRPKPRWQFLLKGYVLWVIFGINVLLGAIFFVVTLLSLRDNDWDVYKYLDQNFLEHIITTMPYLRITALALFIFLAYYNYKHTEKGYKKRTRWIVVMSLVIVMLIGGTLFVIGAENKIEKLLAKNLPYYSSIEERKIKVWSHPKQGLLAGKIVKIKSAEEMEIVDYQQEVWEVDTSEAEWRGPNNYSEVGERVKIIGKQEEGNKFKAQEVRPWEGGYRGGHRSGYYNRFEHVEEYNKHDLDDDYRSENKMKYREEHREEYKNHPVNNN